ncbi:hypothetical protein IFR04_000349 [Cadophora malorum]|uniref:DUF7514 domain-containing protein n=1 Tax=Cadophora malorum TaxID=108018 RepID=A0A8H7WKQ3_9HELO|nr:hypothetical protein IFR04_000349 [Cadophora malorum]
MAYDAYGRPLRSNGEPDYFDPLGSPAATDYTNHSTSSSQNYYGSSEPRDSYHHIHHREPTNPRRRESPPVASKMASAADRGDQLPTGPDGVSPELIAAITEKVKREVFEQLKQTGSVDIPSQGPPMQREPSNKSSSTSSPPPTARRVYTPPSPTQTGRQTYTQSFAPPPVDPMRSHPGSPLEEPLGGNRFADRGAPPPSSPEKPSGVRFSDRSAAARPAGNRTFSTAELSTIDQKWGRLFENDGKPTQRLGQFLRGLANHIIEEFPAKKSIVVTPSKMAAYYAAHTLDKEPHPLLTIFRAHSNEHISRLYQDLGCQHHLVQEDSHSAPIIPALTPVGFAHWMTINILAYPDEESERLAKVVIAMPIDADGDLVDGKPERLPKQISRHLLPDREDRSYRKLLESAIENFLDDLGSTSRRKASITSPPLSRHSSSTARPRSGSPPARGSSTTRPYGPVPVEVHQAPRTSPTTSKAQPIERERKPYGGVPTTSETSSNEEGVKIERDRQPYTAQPGSGKNHIDNLNPPSSTRPARANSTSSRSSAREQPEQADLRHVRTNSTTSQNRYPPRAGTRRSSSPPFKSFSQSTPDDLHSASSKYGPNPSSSTSSFTTNPSSKFSPSSRGSDPVFPPPPSGPPPVDIHRRSRDERNYRRGTEDDSRFTGEFNSPRDAEKWDRYQDAARGEDRFGSYERGSVSIDPRDRGAPLEEWYREKGRGAEYDGLPRRY